jgi:ADP-heptose:LPS heptosyltransferase
MPSGPFPILFFAPTGLQDAIMVSGVFKRLHDEIDNASFTVVTGPDAAALFREAPKREVTVIDQGSGLGAKLALWSRLRRRRWGLILDAAGRKLSGSLPAKRKVRALELEPRPGHKVVQAARLLKLEDDPPSPFLFTSDKTRARADEILGEGDGPVLALAPHSSWIGRAWPVERYVRLAAQLLEAPQLADGRLLIVGAPEARQTAETLRRTIARDRWIDLTGEPDPLVIHACLQRARLFVGGAVAVSHLAAAAGAPTLALFGPDDEAVSGPWGQRSRVLILRGPRSAQAIQAIDPSLDQPVCHMLDLPVESALAAARELLDETAPGVDKRRHG